MPLKDRVERLGGLIKALAAVVALLPGVAVLTGLVDIPPTLVQLVQMLSVTVSLLVLIAVILLTDRLRRLRAEAVVAMIAVAAVAGAGLATAYFQFAKSHIAVVESAGEEIRYLIPLAPSPRVRQIVAPYGDDYNEALQTSLERRELARLLEQEGGDSAAVMIALMVLAQALLIGAVVAGAWKLTSDDGAAAAPRVHRTAQPPSSAPEG